MNIHQQMDQLANQFEKKGEYGAFAGHKESIQRILELKKEKNVLILGHNYMAPEVYYLSGENERGDSLQLAQFAATSDKPIILFDGVRFMAETAKILNPEKKVLIADKGAGCSLADPFRGEDVVKYKESYPGRPIVLYINSYADAKAEADYCCTSANALNVIKHAAKTFNTKEVIFLPDSLMGQNLDEELKKEKINLTLIYPGKFDKKHGSCEVHEQITADMIRNIRNMHHLKKGDPQTAVLVHWECKNEVLQEADFYGSTSQMRRHIVEHPQLKRVYLGTECEMTANLQHEFPHVEFVKSCAVFCKHMRKITIEKMVQALEKESPEIIVPEHIRLQAKKSIERMLAIP